GRPAGRLQGQPRLADPRLPGDHYTPAVPGHSGRQRRVDRLQRGVPADDDRAQYLRHQPSLTAIPNFREKGHWFPEREAPLQLPPCEPLPRSPGSLAGPGMPGASGTSTAARRRVPYRPSAWWSCGTCLRAMGTVSWVRVSVVTNTVPL